MKQLLFLLLFPCLALAQYQGNGNQKITLGEQTSADGLVWRGRTTDTVNLMTSKLDTSAYLVLDTITEAIWLYRASTTPKWNRVVDSLNNLQGQLSLTSKVTGVLPVANGGTNLSTFTAANRVPFSSSSSQLTTASNLTFINSGNRTFQVTASNNNEVALFKTLNAASQSFEVGIWGSTTGAFGAIANSNAYTYGSTDFATVVANDAGSIKWGVGTSATERMRLNTTGLGIGVTPAVQFHTTGGVRFATFAGGGTTTLSVDNNGDLARTSSFELKKDVISINYGLNEILQINPINFNWIDGDKFGNENENGFIAEDVMSIIPNVVGSDAHGLFMDYTKLIPILTKAIQEQQALIKALEKRILNLENK